MMKFRALQNFDCLVTKSQYVKGLVYTIRRGNTALASRARKWAAQGKITFIDGGAAVTGKGE